VKKLLAQSVAIITGGLKKSALADDPAFSTLAVRPPKTLAVWVDQTALNSDYYFKHYWLMSDVGSLKNIRSGMFDFSIGDGKLVEDREFLLKEPVAASSVANIDATQLMSRVPDGAPYYKIGRADSDAVNRAFASILSLAPNERDAVGLYRKVGYDDDYSRDKFEKYIDETDEDAVVKTEKDEGSNDISSVVASGRPRALLTLARSRAEQAPLFVEFDKAAVMILSSPSALDRPAFERTLANSLAARLLVRGQKLDAQWITKNDKGVRWRVLEAPVLGWGVQYAIEGDQLIVSNEPRFLSELLATRKSDRRYRGRDSIQRFTVLRPAKVRDDFQSTFDRLAVKDDFFVGNILSLIDSAPAIEKIQISRSHHGTLMREQLTVTLEQNKKR
jgi:hypothetical protein